MSQDPLAVDDSLLLTVAAPHFGLPLCSCLQDPSCTALLAQFYLHVDDSESPSKGLDVDFVFFVLSGILLFVFWVFSLFLCVPPPIVKTRCVFSF